MERAKIKFWGVRGSIATSGRETNQVGGNTACVEISAAGRIIICDAGTGIRPLGISLVRRLGKRPISAHILLSHLHLDHYMGLPFFQPLYKKENDFVIAGPGACRMGFGKALSRAVCPPYFPISLSEMPAGIRLKTLSERPFAIGKIRVVPKPVNHPGGALGFRFYFPGGKSLVHITDNEPDTARAKQMLVEWMKGADVLIHDAQYSIARWHSHLGWGHSPFAYSIELAREAGIARLILFHFDPQDSDRRLARMLRNAQRLAKGMHPKLRVELAREGRSIVL